MDDLVLTDGGLETTLLFHEGVDLPQFAAVPLLDSREGRDRLRRYFEPYLDIARRHGAAFQLDTATWRASRDWGERLGYDREALDRSTGTPSPSPASWPRRRLPTSWCGSTARSGRAPTAPS
jgi:S-methylmethionine-dependent homocysteine/selenocysteine methylase